MHNFTYVSKKEAAPYKEELIELIKAVQDEVRDYFTFRFDFIGSSSRNMITCERNGNIGYDFDVNIEPNDPEKYSPQKIRNIIIDALNKHMLKFGYSTIENSTSVITIKAVDRKNKRIQHRCDFAIVRTKDGHQQYIRFWKVIAPIFSWQDRGNYYDIDEKLQWIQKKLLKPELRERYLYNKNRNNDPNKHSRTIFAESVNQICNEYGFCSD